MRAYLATVIMVAKVSFDTFEEAPNSDGSLNQSLPWPQP